MLMFFLSFFLYEGGKGRKDSVLLSISPFHLSPLLEYILSRSTFFIRVSFDYNFRHIHSIRKNKGRAKVHRGYTIYKDILIQYTIECLLAHVFILIQRKELKVRMKYEVSQRIIISSFFFTFLLY